MTADPSTSQGTPPQGIIERGNELILHSGNISKLTKRATQSTANEVVTLSSNVQMIL